MTSLFTKARYLIAISCAVVLCGVGYTAWAQNLDFFTASTARTYVIAEEEAEAGDIVAYDEELVAYRLAHIGDTALVGVIVDNPLILLETDADGLPVVQAGEALVNVSTLGGEITAGDYIAPSPIPGKGWRAQNDGAHVIGIAEERLVATSTVVIEGEEVMLGVVRILLDSSRIQANTNMIEAIPFPAGSGGGTIPRTFKYIMALLIGIGSVYLAFSNFGANIRNGIISIGRNPLAKRTIQTMVILNILLIILVAGGGIVLSIAILLLPF